MRKHATADNSTEGALAKAAHAQIRPLPLTRYQRGMQYILNEAHLTITPCGASPAARAAFGRPSMDSKPSSPQGSGRGCTIDHSTLTPGSKAKIVQMMDKHNFMGKVKLAASFKTLRDMKSDLIIPEKDLIDVKKLGAGAFGSVHLCKYVVDGKESLVAVKRIKPELLSNQKDMELFLKECELLKKLSYK